jgi:hypothetical protein
VNTSHEPHAPIVREWEPRYKTYPDHPHRTGIGCSGATSDTPGGTYSTTTNLYE